MTKQLGCLLSPFAGVILLIGVLFLLLTGLLAAAFGDGGPASGPGNAEIAQHAQQMAAHLHDGTDGFDVVMDQGFPQPALDYWDHLCGRIGCGRSLSGKLQCGQFVAMAYGWSGVNLVGANKVVEWWADYERQAGWTEIANGSEMPQPGDMLLLDTPDPGPFAGEGHAGIVVAVALPVGNTPGTLTFAEANGPTPLVTMPLILGGMLQLTWPGYRVQGFIRHQAAPIAGATATITVRHDQLDPAEYDQTGFFTWGNWAYSACSAGAMTNVIDGYTGGHTYRIVDILKVEYQLGEITPKLGLLEEAGIAKTAAQFGFADQSTTSYSLEQVVNIAQAGHPVIVDFPPDRFAGGHLLVVTGGLIGSDGNVATVYVVDSGFDRNSIERAQFLRWWAGQVDILTPRT